MQAPPPEPAAPSQPLQNPDIRPITLETGRSTEGRTGRVLVIYTGGTMGMTKQNGSLTPTRGYLPRRISEMREMADPEMPQIDLIEYDPLLDSSNIGPKEWAAMAQTIGKHYYDYDGFVIIHGTDTLSYTASALSFMLEDLGKAVVVTGSIIPMCEVYNDARRNLVISVVFAAQLELCEVVLFFNDRLLRGNRSVKVDSLGLAAFESPNFPPLATIGARLHPARHLWRPPPTARLRVHTTMDSNIVVIRLAPGFDDSMLHSMVNDSPHLQGMVLSLYGTGNGPASKRSFIDLIKTAIDRGICVVICSQCLRGAVSLATYEVGRVLLDLGVVAAGDMTTEAVVTKLGYLLGRGQKGPELRQAMGENLRGELTPGAHENSTLSQMMGNRRSRL